MVEVKNILNRYEPRGMVVDVDEERAIELVNQHGYEYVNKDLKSEVLVDKKEPEEQPEPEEDKPNKTWTEQEIKDWIKEKKIPVKYSITNDEKVDKLLELKKKGYI